MQTIDLNGVWRLTGQGKKALGPFEATVPGNIELELVKNNIVPDPYFGANEKFLRPYEFYDWTFTRDFDVPADFPAGADLVFDCIDTVAEVYLNGEKIAEPANGFIRHTFAVDDKIKRGQKNTVTVVVKSPILAAAKYELDHRDKTLWRNTEGLPLRKPIHEYGWDMSELSRPTMVAG